MGYRLGIDVGTTFTAAAVRRSDRVEMVGLGNRALQMPSVVYVDTDGAVVVGEAAESRGTGDPLAVVREFKRRLGDPVPILVRGRPYSPELLTARVLQAVVDVTSEREGEAPAGVTVTHPATWGPYKLDLLRRAMSLAELPDALLCPEPVAAAVTYSRRNRVADGEAVVIYDLGGGTFDTAVLQQEDGGFRVVGHPEGIEHLGGVDIDEAVFRHVLGAMSRPVADLDPDDPDVVVALARLRRDCVLAKEQLSSDTQATVTAALPGGHETIRLGRSELEELVQPAFEETVAAVRRVLRSAQLSADEVAAIVLVGGSSRIPLVSEVLVSAFGRPLAVDTHPKHDVALGAAWFDADVADAASAALPAVAPSRSSRPSPPRAVPPPHVPGPWRGPVAGAAPSGSPRVPLPPRLPAAAPLVAPEAPPAVPREPVVREPLAREPEPVGPTGPRPDSVAPVAAEPDTAPPVRPDPGPDTAPPVRPDPGLDTAPSVWPDARPHTAPPVWPDPDPAPGDPGPVAAESEHPPPPSDEPPSADPAAGPGAPAPRRRRARWVALVGVAALVVAGGIVAATGAFGGASDDTGATAAPTASPSPTPSKTRTTSGGRPVAVPLAADLLLFGAFADGITTLRTRNVSSGTTTTIATLPGYVTAVLSHDRRTIAYAIVAAPVAATGSTADTASAGGLFLMSVDGLKGRPLVVGGNPACKAPYAPAFGPDDDRLAIVCGTVGNATMSVVDARGKVIVPLVGGVSGPPSFSPDGKRIVYASTAGGGLHLATVTVDAAHSVTALTSGAAKDADPVWSADGRTILFDRTDATGADVWSFALDGAGQTRLTSASDVEQQPDWAPGDVSRIVYVRAGAFWTMAADGSDQHPMTS